jgi:hypothetical protein
VIGRYGAGVFQRHTQPNLTRMLAKLAAAGFITAKAHGQRKALSAVIRTTVVEFDASSDHVRFFLL